jgi:hypothetical protein
MFIVFFGSVIIKDSPLNAVQMLWVNLIMDTFAALALATEPPADDILTRPPYNKDAPIMSKLMWRNVFGHAVYQILILILVIFAGQGTIVYNYSDECFNKSKALATPSVLEYAPCDKTGKSTLYNPFYTDKLYMDAKVLGDWKEIKVNGKALQSTDYEQNSLNLFTCFVYQQSHFGDGKTCEQLQKQSNWATIKVVPSDAPNYTGTMKLLHFTYVF